MAEFRTAVSRDIAATYIIVIGLILFPSVLGYVWKIYFASAILSTFCAILVALFVISCSTKYSLEEKALICKQGFKTKKFPYEQIKRVRAFNIPLFPEAHEISVTLGLGGHYHAQGIGEFHGIHASWSGVLIDIGGDKLFVSPKNPNEFIKQLTEKVSPPTELLPSLAQFIGSWVAGRVSKRFNKLDEALGHIFWWEEDFEVLIEDKEVVSKGRCPVYGVYRQWCEKACESFIKQLADKYGFDVRKTKKQPEETFCEFRFSPRE